MIRTFALLMLTASLLAGCGTAPVAPQLALGTKASATSLDSTPKVQIYNAFQRVDGSKAVRVVVMYWVRKSDTDREFRQLILDTVPSQDRVIYRSGYRPTDLVLNGADVLHNEAGLLQISRDLGALQYHTVTKEQQQVVALAYDILMDLVH